MLALLVAVGVTLWALYVVYKMHYPPNHEEIEKIPGPSCTPVLGTPVPTNNMTGEQS